MTERTYPACIRELYESEIFGEAVFDAIIDHARTPRERYHLATLLQLETETKARLRPFLLKHGISLNEAMDLSMLPGIIKAYNSMDWKSFMGANIPTVETFLASFEAIVGIGPSEDQQVLNSMVIHEVLPRVTLSSPSGLTLSSPNSKVTSTNVSSFPAGAPSF